MGPEVRPGARRAYLPSSFTRLAETGKRGLTHFGPDVRMQVFTSTWAPGPTLAEERLTQVLARIREALGETTTEEARS